MGKRKLEIEIIDTHKGGGFKASEKEAGGWAKKLGGFAKVAAIGLGVAGIAAVGIGFKLASAAEEAQKVGRQTGAVLKSTGGAAHIGAKGVADLADKLALKAGIDHKVIQSGENVLLTFTGIRNEVGKGNDIFNQATAVITDMSVALKEDLQSANIQVGKALNDPIRGITALQRVGVSFTAAQKKQIQGLVEHGHKLEAQKIILRELNTEFAGSAAAQATVGDRLNVVWTKVQETLGKALLPIFEKAGEWLADKLPMAMAKVKPFIDRFTVTAQHLGKVFGRELADIFRTKLVPAFQAVASFVTGKLVPGLQRVGTWLTDHKPLLIGVAVAIAVPLVGAFVAWAASAAAAAVATIAATLPIIAIGAAIAALVAGVIWAYQNWGWFRTAVDAVASFMRDTLWPILQTIAGWIIGTLVPTIGNIILWFWHWRDTVSAVTGAVTGAIGGVINWVKTNWPKIAIILSGPIGWAAAAIVKNWGTIKAGATAVKDWVVGKFNAVVSFITGLPGRIAGAARGMWDGIGAAFKAVINRIIRWWNNLHFPTFHIPEISLGPLGSIGGGKIGGWDLPNIHELAKGGIIKARPGGTLVRAAEAGHDEAFMPLDGRHALGGDTYILNADFSGAVIASETDAEQLVQAAWNRIVQKGGFRLRQPVQWAR